MENVYSKHPNIEVNNENIIIDDTFTDEMSNQTNDKFSTTYECENKVYYKSNAVSCLLECSTKMSSKRTNRLFNLNDNNFNVNQHYEYDLSTNQIFLTDIIATYIKYRNYNSLILVLFSIDKIILNGELKTSIDTNLLTSSTLSGTILKLNSFVKKRIYLEGSYDLSIKDIICSNRSIIKYSTKEINRKISCSFLI